MMYKVQVRFLFHSDIKIKIPEIYDDSIFDDLFGILEDVNRKYNSYSENSYIDKINKNSGHFVKVDLQTIEILRKIIHLSKIIGGEYDITIMPLIRLWGFYKQNPILPSLDKIKKVKRLVNYKKIIIDKKRKRVKIEKTDKKFVDDFLYEDDLLALAIKESRLTKMLSDLKENSLHGEQRNKILEILKSEDMELLKSFDEYVKILLLKADERLGNIKESATDEMKRLIQKVKTENLRTQKENLQAELENAEIQGDENLKTKILSKIIELNKELNSGKR